MDRLDLRILAARGRGAVGVVDVRLPPRRHRDRRVPHLFVDELSLRLPHDRLEPEQVLDDLVLDSLLHQGEELEGLLLVLDQRIALAVAAQPDPFLQVVDGEQVVFPLLVDDLEHHEALVEPHRLGPEDLFLGLVDFAQCPEENLADLVAVLPGEVESPGLDAEVLLQVHAERGHVPLVERLVFRQVPAERVIEDDVRESEDLVLALPAFQDVAPEAVDLLALPVHHVVVLEEVLPGLEVAPLDLLLSPLDGAGDHSVLDGNAFLHSELAEDVLQAIRAEDPHEVVFERNEEPGRAGIPLAAAPAAELVVHTARLVPLGPQDVQASRRQDDVAVFCGLGAKLSQERGELLGGLRFRPAVLRERFGIAAEHDVRSAARHVRRNGDGTGLAGLRDDLGFLLVELGVEDDVADALALENL